MSLYDVFWVDTDDVHWVDTDDVHWVPHVDVSQIVGSMSMFLAGEVVSFITFSTPQITNIVINSSNPADISFDAPILTRMLITSKSSTSSVQMSEHAQMSIISKNISIITFSNSHIPKMIIGSLIPATTTFDVPILTRMTIDGKRPANTDISSST